jgi:asparagine synthetase B (glutamine-hydrolysing)
MCGIAGIKYFASGKRVTAESLEAMNAQMVHRGPDDSGYRLFDSFGMAMRRLSIIDLSVGRQPITRCGRCGITSIAVPQMGRRRQRGFSDKVVNRCQACPLPG